MSTPPADLRDSVNQTIVAQMVMAAFTAAAADPPASWPDAADEFDRFMRFYLAERPDLFPRMMVCVQFVLGTAARVLAGHDRDEEPTPDQARRALLLAVDNAHPISEPARRALDTALLDTPDLRPTPRSTSSAIFDAKGHGPLFEGTTALLRRIVDQHDDGSTPASWISSLGQILGMAMYALTEDPADTTHPDGGPPGTETTAR